MTSDDLPDDLQTALEALSTQRLERLEDRLERDPDSEGMVGGWPPRSPMVIAGFDPTRALPNQPEHRFAQVWDGFARSAQKVLIPPRSTGRAARRADVQVLLRSASSVLAYRSARERPRDERQPAARRSSRRTRRNA
jgi:hypothetical protein